MSEQRLITVEHEDFKATVPWTYSIPAMELLGISVLRDQTLQFERLAEKFRDFLSPEMLPEIDRLDIAELAEVIGQWIGKSTELKMIKEETK